MEEVIKLFLSKPEARLLRKYCKGCRFFMPEKNVRDICSIIGWYNSRNFQEIKEYVKHCPCNQKCLVKPSCREEQCPIWMQYVSDVADERNKHLK